MSKYQRVVDVVIVGGGLSGLRAAVEIHRSGFSCVVLEALDQVGGKTVGLGAAWINDGNQSEISSLAKWFGLDLISQHVSGKSLYQRKDGRVLEYFPGFADDVLDPEVIELHRRLNLLADSELIPGITMSLDSAAGYAADTVAEAFLGVSAGEVSALFMIELIRSSGSLEQMSSSFEGGSHCLRVRQGAESFSIHLAGILPPGTVHLSSPVIEIRQHEDRPRCFTQVADGRVFESKKVIVSTPRIAHRNVKFAPPLPPRMTALVRRGIPGFHARMDLEYSEPWWRERGLSGFTELLASCGPVSLTRDTCIEGDKHYSLTCSIVGRAGREWSTLPATERKQKVVDQIGDIFGSTPGKEPISVPITISEKQWLDGMVTVMPPVVPTQILAKISRITSANRSTTRPTEIWRIIGQEMCTLLVLKWQKCGEGTWRGPYNLG
ncbi:putative amine oxidase [Podospora aff. communis PSN243]|uniref:Amine oxidase n=1 Tax=Podospora aff. communis PSN243 TaxID=3040156 RepID=A0AAV9GBB5_9PEZI|nr:putative amine oxidase [Podospora aff. communis PSN243]